MQWAFDLNDGRWMTTVYPDVPTAIKPDTDGTLDFLSGLKLFKVSPDGDRFAGVNFTAEWESNNIQVLKEGRGFGNDCLLRGIIIEYESDVLITAYLYLDDSATATPVAGTTLSASYKRVAFQVPLGSVCKYFHFKFSVTTTAASQTWKIKSAEVFFDEIPRGGDVLAV
jgi:hypothetical protein